MEYKVCFVGIGSIARRHINNLSKICNNRHIGLNIDALRRNAVNPIPSLINNVYTNVNDLPSDYDIIFITNPTFNHLQTIIELQHKSKHFFVEKPLVSAEQIEEAQKKALYFDGVFYVAGPLKFNAVIQYVMNNVDTRDIISIRSISSSYLPKWRPEIDYRESYSAHKALGGGVSIDLIHEWDYITYLFGFPEKVFFMKGKKSDLEIDCDDYAIYIADYKKMIVEVHLDYFGLNSIRKIEMITKKGTIIGDLINCEIKYLESNDIISFKEDRDDYQIKEIEFFLNLIDNNKGYNGFDHAIKLLKLSQGRLD